MIRSEYSRWPAMTQTAPNNILTGIASQVPKKKNTEEKSEDRCLDPSDFSYNCHMPRVVYGIMSIHPTHDITVPDPQLTFAQLVPNACNQCHLDRSVNWAVRVKASRYATKWGFLDGSGCQVYAVLRRARLRNADKKGRPPCGGQPFSVNCPQPAKPH